MGFDADRFIYQHLQPRIFENPRYIKCQQQNKIKVIFVGLHAQSRILDEHYPHQSRENAIRFNQNISAYFRDPVQIEKYYTNKIIEVDPWNLTADAQSSDGLHFLSDVNVVEANHILNVVKMLP